VRAKLQALFAFVAQAIARRPRKIRVAFDPGPRVNTARARRGHFISNVLVGTGISLLLFLARDSPNFLRFEDLSFDCMTRFSGAVAREAIANRFVWFDIDDQTYEAWQEPLCTPRDKVYKMIRYAAESGAELIVVDIDLTHLSQCNNFGAATLGAPASIGGRTRQCPLHCWN
jgi:CHASE2 domain-containing sensor protein